MTVLLFRLRNARTERVRERLSRCLDELGAELRPGTIVLVEESRMRRRRLPIGS